MSYGALHSHCQTLTPAISRNLIRDKVLALTRVPKVSTVRTTLDIKVCRGFYLSAQNQDHPLVRQFGSHVIVLARGMDENWERFVFVKELMHLFDDLKEATDSGEEFDRLLAEMSGSATPERSAQWQSEIECFWKALAAFCPEQIRLKLGDLRAKKQIDDYGISLQLKIPQQYVGNLFHPRYEITVQGLCQTHQVA